MNSRLASSGWIEQEGQGVLHAVVHMSAILSVIVMINGAIL